MENQSLGLMSLVSIMFPMFLVMFPTPCQLQTISQTYMSTTVNPLIGFKCDYVQVESAARSLLSVLVSYMTWEAQNPSQGGGVVSSWNGDGNVYTMCYRCYSSSVPTTLMSAPAIYISENKLGQPDTTTDLAGYFPCDAIVSGAGVNPRQIGSSTGSMVFGSATVGSITTGLVQNALYFPAHVIGITSPGRATIDLSACPCCTDLKTCTSGLTIAAWFKFTDCTTGNGRLIALFAGRMKLEIEAGCRLIAIVGTSDGSYFTELLSVPPGEWHLVVLSWLPTEGLRLFINGCMVSAISDVNNPATASTSFAVKVNIMTMFNEDYLFDEFYIWFRQQTNEFIMKHYNSYHG